MAKQKTVIVHAMGERLVMKSRPDKKQTERVGERVEYWKNKKGEFNFALFNRNGQQIGGSGSQGYKRRSGVFNGLESLAKFFKGDTDLLSSYTIIEVNGPGRKHRGKRAA